MKITVICTKCNHSTEHVGYFGNDALFYGTCQECNTYDIVSINEYALRFIESAQNK